MNSQDNICSFNFDNMEYHDIVKLQEILDQRYDERYVKREECDSSMRDVYKIIADFNTKFAVLEQRIALNNGLSLAIAGGIVALVIKVFLGG